MARQGDLPGIFFCRPAGDDSQAHAFPAMARWGRRVISLRMVHIARNAAFFQCPLSAQMPKSASFLLIKIMVERCGSLKQVPGKSNGFPLSDHAHFHGTCFAYFLAR
jgi:hypothetical protein